MNNYLSFFQGFGKSTGAAADLVFEAAPARTGFASSAKLRRLQKQTGVEPMPPVGG